MGLQGEDDVESDEEDEGVGSRHSTIFYWREWLEKFLDSMWVTAFILILLLLDISMFFATTVSGDSNNQSPGWGPEDYITVVVTVSSLVDLSLRQLVQGVRFWEDKLSIAYFLVIWLSAAVLLVKLVAAASPTIAAADGTTNALRVISRVAMALRLLRIIISIRNARKFSGKVQRRLRLLISQNRRRYKRHGFDLDVTYITSRVVAMSAPSFGATSTYRNDIHVVARFLSYMHYGHFFVFNLCDTYDSSDGLIGQYHAGMIFQQVQRIPTEDHCAPLLIDLHRFCEDASSWLRQHPRNVVVAHCKGGKGRTGVFISALMVWTGHRRSALDALELFTFRRTANYDPELGLDSSLSHGANVKKCNQTVEGPSQIRYVHYIEAMLYTGVNAAFMHRMILREIRFKVGPVLKKKPWNMSFTIKCLRALVFDSKSERGSTFLVGKDSEDVYTFISPAAVWGDVCIDFYANTVDAADSKRKHLFFMTFHTAFYVGVPELFFAKGKLDKICKDKKNKKCDSDFGIALRFEKQQNSPNEKESLEPSGLKSLMKQFGTIVRFSPGEAVLDMNTHEETVLLVVRGIVEGVVDDVPSEMGIISDHPLGRCVPAQATSRVEEVTNCCQRSPNLCIIGPGSVLPSSSFLNCSALTMQYKARTEVEAYKIKKQNTQRNKKTKWTVLQSVFAAAHTIKASNRRSSQASGRASVARSSRERSDELSRGSNSMERTGSKDSIVTPEGSPLRSETAIQGRRSSVDIGFKGFEIEGMNKVDLATFYQRLSLILATRLTRIQAEALRIGHLKAFNDAQTVMVGADKDESERLIKFCKTRFQLLTTERILSTVKCWYQSEQMSGGRWNRMRLLILRNSIIFDPGFYGPRVSTQSFAVHGQQILGVIPGSRNENTKESSITLIALDYEASGLLISRKSKQVQVRVKHRLRFTDDAHYRRVYALISDLAKKGASLRLRERERLFDSPALAALLDRAEVHRLRSGETMQALSLNSLFIVTEGEIKLFCRSTGDILRVISEGFVFGETNFALGTTSRTYHARASVDSAVVLEISGPSVMRMLDGDAEMRARLYFVLCQVLHIEIQAGLEDTFPGTWNRNHVLEPQGNEVSKQPSNVHELAAR